MQYRSDHCKSVLLKIRQNDHEDAIQKFARTDRHRWPDQGNTKMNVFVLCTGRTGSVAFIEACQSITNFSATHESRMGMIGDARLKFPGNHIEADNRLSWFLGRMDTRYGKDAYYVHLQRDLNKTADSFAKRTGKGIMRAFADGILLPNPLVENPDEAWQVAYDLCQTVDQNIRHFLKDKPNKMEVHLENIVEDFENFWVWIEAEGDLEQAKRSLNTRKNTSEEYLQATKRNSLKPYSHIPLRMARKLERAIKGLPSYFYEI